MAFGNVHIMRKEGQRLDLPRPHLQAELSQFAAQESFQLNYYGGPVISQVNIVGVFWGSKVNSTVKARMGDFYQALTNSPMIDFLSEYNTTLNAVDGSGGTNQEISRGGYGGSFTIRPRLQSQKLTDAAIQQEIQRQIDAGALPANDNNTLYMVHFPPGVQITTSDGSRSCSEFCAYHGSYQNNNGDHVYYGVMPDFSKGGCSQGCGSGSMINNFTTTASHEVIEAITDPEIAEVTGNSLAAPAAWYDPVANMEIGDICAFKSSGSIVSLRSQRAYAVQGEWSNSRNACYNGN